jgi:hypothetical protein
LVVLIVEVWMRDDFKAQFVVVVLLEVEFLVKPWQFEAPALRLYWSQARAQALNVAAYRIPLEGRSLAA